MLNEKKKEEMIAKEESKLLQYLFFQKNMCLTFCVEYYPL